MSPRVVIGALVALTVVAAVALVVLLSGDGDDGGSSATTGSGTPSTTTSGSSSRTSSSTTEPATDDASPTLRGLPDTDGRGFTGGPACDTARDLRLAVQTAGAKAVVCGSGGSTTLRLVAGGASTTANAVVELPAGTYTGIITPRTYIVTAGEIVIRDGLTERLRERATGAYTP